MKLVEKVKKEKKKTIGELTEELQAIKKHLYVECDQCDGTGKPKTKNGVPPKGGHGSARCRTCGGLGTLGRTALSVHINKQSVEIRVLPEGHDPKKHGGNDPDKSKNGWEDYSGRFDVNADEEMSIVIGKAMAHFEHYFKDGFYHRGKRLGVFLSNATTSGRKLIEEFHTEE